MINKTCVFGLLLICGLVTIAPAPVPVARWSEAKANEWYAKQPWLVGSNYIPATAINQLEMWQADTFDPEDDRQGARLGREPRHDDDAGVPARSAVAAGRRRLPRADRRASSTSRRGIRSSRSSCCSTRAGIRIRSSDRSARRSLACTIPAGCRARERRPCRIPAEYPRLEAYVTGVVRAFGKDPRVLGWDVWNEPDNMNDEQLRDGGTEEQGGARAGSAAAGLRVGARSRRAAAADVRRLEEATGRPTTSCRRRSGSSSNSSDVISFHNYDSGAGVREAHQVAAAVPSPDPLHRVHGTRQRQHLPGFAARLPRSTRSRPSTGASSRARRRPTCLGLVAEALRRPRAGGVVPRDLQAGRHAVQTGRGEPDSIAHGGREISGRRRALSRRVRLGSPRSNGRPGHVTLQANPHWPRRRRRRPSVLRRDGGARNFKRM